MSTQFNRDIDYWNHKVKAFLHDPPDKAIHIPGHEARANRLLDALGIQASLDPAEYKAADIIASGMDRAVLPGYSPDAQKNGAIDFCRHPAVTHPTGADGQLSLSLPISNRKELLHQVETEMCALLKKDVGQFTDGRGLSEQSLYKGSEASFAPARFHYLFFLLRRRLAEKNIGGLGGLWHRMPADTRIPDHSIWQHSGLVSALASCFRLSDKNQAGLMVFNIAPIQDFIGRARKLRDYWAGSIILSWLAFEGIKAVIFELGADHILYPSLHGQPLIDDLLCAWQMDGLADKQSNSHGVASFPNKFVCLVPVGMENEIAERIQQAIQDKWLALGQATLARVEKLVGPDEYITRQFTRQMGTYWEYSWAATPLLVKQNKTAIAELLPEEGITTLFAFVEDTDKLLAEKNINSGSGQGPLYGASHRLAQTMLAAGKSYRTEQREKEPGIKCDMFGEFEALRFAFKDGDDHNPPPTQDPFWQTLKEEWNPKSDFGRSERLCAIGLVKRLAYQVCRSMDDHPLKKMFKNAGNFPSTTEMALHDWHRQLERHAREDSKLAAELAEFSGNSAAQLAQWFHAINEPEQVQRGGYEITDIDERQKQSAGKIFLKHHKVKDVHKYYALLMMDGDRMGSLVNGETLGARWKSVLHPELAARMAGRFEEKYKKFWQKHFGETRQISPAVHAAVSEALGDFSLLSAPEIIEKKYKGRLIYAGGDDVCAIMPVSTVLAAAREIAESYGRGFVFMDEKGRITFPDGSWSPQPGKLAMYLGKGENISISAGIMIAHHKKPLVRVIDRAHQLLDKAKKEGGRNSFCLELDKRSGGGRLFMAGWNDLIGRETILDHFMKTAEALQQSEKAAMSASLAYRLAMFEDGIIPLLDREELLQRFVCKQLDRSGLANELTKEERENRLRETAAHVAALLAHQNKNEEGHVLRAEALVIANFMGHCLAEREAAQ